MIVKAAENERKCEITQYEQYERILSAACRGFLFQNVLLFFWFILQPPIPGTFLGGRGYE